VHRLLKCVARNEQVEGREIDSRLYDYVRPYYTVRYVSRPTAGGEGLNDPNTFIGICGLDHCSHKTLLEGKV